MQPIKQERTNIGRLALLGAALFLCIAPAAVRSASADTAPAGLTYPIVDTGQHRIYSSTAQLFTVPKPGDPYYGQDGQYAGNQPRYRDNGDGTVTDLVTGLMWQKNVDYNHPLTYKEAQAAVKKLDLGGYHDWRIPTIKQLYSLIDFRGHMTRGNGSIPFIDTRYFNFQYGRASLGERKIDTQIMSNTLYVGTTMHHAATQFGVNFADGRIKGYPLGRLPNGRIVRKYYRFVRGNPKYGVNRFVDNGDGTISDLATGLMWAKSDSSKPMNWKQALAYCNKLNLAGYHDWRLPNAKELQSIVDYNRAPDATDPAKRGPAIEPIFDVSNPQEWDWTSTTHLDGPFIGMRAVYIAFGEATGYMRNRFTGERQLLDVHGAGAQRSDPKSGNPDSPRWVHGFGPQGDVIRIYNYVRPVRNVLPGTVKVVQPDLTPVPGQNMSGGQRGPGARSGRGPQSFGGPGGAGRGMGGGRGGPGPRFGQGPQSFGGPGGAGPNMGGGRGGPGRAGPGMGGGQRGQQSRLGPYREAFGGPDQPGAGRPGGGGGRGPRARFARGPGAFGNEDGPGSYGGSPGRGYGDQYASRSANEPAATGLRIDKGSAFGGYTLFAPMSSTKTYLIDDQGHVVHTWESTYRPGLSARLLPNGDLLRCGHLRRSGFTTARAGGAGGVVQEWNWNGQLVWSYRCANADRLQNHDVAMLPNGDVLIIIWQRKDRAQALAAGRNPTKLSDGELWSDSVIEVKPTGKTTGRIVWRWNQWDHLIQDYDPSKANYGKPADHPGRLDVNTLPSHGPASRGGADWTHANSIAYNPRLDQILLSFRNTSEIYVIDHGTTTAQAAGHTGGRYGRGGDFLYRWGNPANYDAGTRHDRSLFGQHDASWIPQGLPGAGHMLVFNNRAGTPAHQRYSSVLELAPPINASGHYRHTPGGAFAPARVVWQYRAPKPEAFYSSHLGSVQRLPNGDTLIDSGVEGSIFEVTPDGDTVWKYNNPYGRGRRHSLFDAFRYAPGYPGVRWLNKLEPKGGSAHG